MCGFSEVESSEKEKKIIYMQGEKKIIYKQAYIVCSHLPRVNSLL